MSSASDSWEVSADALRAIVAKHGLASGVIERHDSIGFVHDVWHVGERLILRIPRPSPALWETWNERAAAPAAHGAGVRTPRLVIFGGDLGIIDVPFTVYERIQGEALSHESLRGGGAAELYTTLGRELATLHACVTECDDLRTTTDRCGGRGPTEDAINGLDDLVASGNLSDHACTWLRERLERLAPAVEESTGLHRFIHHDLSPDNVLVNDGDISGLVDWGEATWGDPAFDLAHLPVRTLPFVVDGYRQVGAFDLDDTAEVRMLWDQLDVARWRINSRHRHDWRRSRSARTFELVAAAMEWPDRWRRLMA